MNATVHQISQKLAAVSEQLAGHAAQPHNGGPTPPPPSTMEARVEKLEKLAERTVEKLASLETDVAVIRSNYATNGDLHKTINDQTWKLITWTTGLGAALVAATFFIAKYAP